MILLDLDYHHCSFISAGSPPENYFVASERANVIVRLKTNLYSFDNDLIGTY